MRRSMTTVQTKPVIFISYAHADERKWLSFVTGYLKPAVKREAVDVWTDRLMRGGDDWDPEIERKLRACDIFVLLVSRNSLSSDYIVDKEIAIIRDRQDKGEDVHFYPLLLTTPTPEVALDLVRGKNLRPRDAKPFSDCSTRERDRHMNEAANEIATIAKEIAWRKSAPEPPSPSPTSSAPEPLVPSTLPPDPKMIGRADRLDELVKAILDQRSARCRARRARHGQDDLGARGGPR